MSDASYRVLFICMGNICRSPAAEGVFREHVRREGHESVIHIDSAGTLDYHRGELPDPRMREAAARRGYRLDSRARQVRAADFEEFDLLIAMDGENLRDLGAFTTRGIDAVRLLGSFLVPGSDTAAIPPVPDPYYGGPEGFERVLDMLEQACPAILEHCLDGMGQPSP